MIGPIHAQAAVAEAGGRPDEALLGYAEASERWGDFPHVYEQSQALLGCARCLEQLGRRSEAAARRTAAEGVLDRLGAMPGAALRGKALPSAGG